VLGDLYLCHGTPTSDLAYLLEDIMDGLPEVRSEGAIRELLQGVQQPVVLCEATATNRAGGRAAAFEGCSVTPVTEQQPLVTSVSINGDPWRDNFKQQGIVCSARLH